VGGGLSVFVGRGVCVGRRVGLLSLGEPSPTVVGEGVAVTEVVAEGVRVAEGTGVADGRGVKVNLGVLDAVALEVGVLFPGAGSGVASRIPCTASRLCSETWAAFSSALLVCAGVFPAKARKEAFSLSRTIWRSSATSRAFPVSRMAPLSSS
jgi:hypothetical protein